MCHKFSVIECINQHALLKSITVFTWAFKSQFTFEDTLHFNILNYFFFFLTELKYTNKKFTILSISSIQFPGIKYIHNVLQPSPLSIFITLFCTHKTETSHFHLPPASGSLIRLSALNLPRLCTLYK